MSKSRFYIPLERYKKSIHWSKAIFMWTPKQIRIARIIGTTLFAATCVFTYFKIKRPTEIAELELFHPIPKSKNFSYDPSKTNEILDAMNVLHELQNRIKRIENGLQYPIQIDGQPGQPMDIHQRMEYYNVPALSVCVIEDGQIDYARGYGKLPFYRKVNIKTKFKVDNIPFPLNPKPVRLLDAIAIGHTLDGKSIPKEQSAVYAAPVEIANALISEMDKQKKKLVHLGYKSGYSYFIVADPEQKNGAVLVSNSPMGIPLSMEVMQSIASEYGWTNLFNAESKSITTNVNNDKYEGVYQLNSHPNVSILLKKDYNAQLSAHVQLHENGTSQASPVSFELYPESSTQFFAKQGITIQFEKPQEAKVKIHATPFEFTMSKKQ